MFQPMTCSECTSTIILLADLESMSLDHLSLYTKQYTLYQAKRNVALFQIQVMSVCLYARIEKLLSLIQTCLNCPTDFKLGMVISVTVRCDLESVATLQSLLVSPQVYQNMLILNLFDNTFLLNDIVSIYLIFGIMIPMTTRYNDVS